MKRLVILMLMWIAPFALKADVIDDIASAIRAGNAKEISKYFADQVDLKVLDQENIYSRAQAEMIIKDFFVKHPVKGFVLVHRSVPKNDSRYAIGTLDTSTGTYRVHYQIKTAAGKHSIMQFRIENSNE